MSLIPPLGRPPGRITTAPASRSKASSDPVQAPRDTPCVFCLASFFKKGDTAMDHPPCIFSDDTRHSRMPSLIWSHPCSPHPPTWTWTPDARGGCTRGGDAWPPRPSPLTPAHVARARRPALRRLASPVPLGCRACASSRGVPWGVTRVLYRGERSKTNVMTLSRGPAPKSVAGVRRAGARA